MSPDVDDIAAWMAPPEDPWSVYIEITVGPVGSVGEEVFGFTVCNPDWLSYRAASEGVVSGRHLLVMTTFSWPSVQAFIESYLADIEGDTWPEVAANVARLAHWEFEDYRPT